MKYTVKESNSVKHIVEFEAPVDEIEKYYTEALASFIEELELPGFRKGKVPSSMAQKYVSEEKVLAEAAENIVSRYWRDYLKEASIEAVSQPEIQVIKMAKGNPFIFTASVEVLRDLELPDIKKIASEIKREEIKVEDREVDDAVSWLRTSRAVLTDKEDQAAEMGDYVEIDISLIEAPALFDHMKGVQRDAFILGKNNVIAGLDEAVVGMKKEEEKEFEGSISQNIDKGQPEKILVKAKVKVISVQKLNLPEINDDWVKSLGRFETVEAMREDIKKGLIEEKKVAESNRQRVEVIDKIVEKVKFEIPSVLLRREEDNLMENLKERVNYEMNIDLPKYFEQIKKTEEEVKADFKKMAEERMKRFLVLHQISKNENILASEEEVIKKVNELLSQYPGEDKSKIDIERVRYMVFDEITREKIFTFLGL